jgi:hypothetical protein
LRSERQTATFQFEPATDPNAMPACLVGLVALLPTVMLAAPTACPEHFLNG